jgi:hypothetical protein
MGLLLQCELLNEVVDEELSLQPASSRPGAAAIEASETINAAKATRR